MEDELLPKVGALLPNVAPDPNDAPEPKAGAAPNAGGLPKDGGAPNAVASIIKILINLIATIKQTFYLFTKIHCLYHPYNKGLIY